MKTFTTSGTGNQQTLSEIETDKIPVYDSVTDAEADLANLAENQIIATHDTGSELSAPVDTVQSGNMHAVTSNAVAQVTTVSELQTLRDDRNVQIKYRTMGKVIIFYIWAKVQGKTSTPLTGFSVVQGAEGLKTALCWAGSHVGEAYIGTDGTAIVADTEYQNAEGSYNGSGELVAFLV